MYKNIFTTILLLSSLTNPISVFGNPFLDLFIEMSNPRPQNIQQTKAAPNLNGETFALHQNIQQYAKHYNIPIDFLAAIIAVESSGKPCAYNRSGATGLMQLMPNTAKEMGIYGDLYDPKENIKAGVKYIRESLDYAHNDIIIASAHYYGGPNKRKWGKRTRRYAYHTIPKKLSVAKQYGWKILIPSTIKRTSAEICLRNKTAMR